MIRISNLSKDYSNKEALKSVCINLERGDIFGLIGENGAGKTTLIKCIAGLVKYKNGDIFINGVNINKNRAESNRDIKVLFDSPPRFDYLTGMEYLEIFKNLAGVNSQMNHSLEELLSMMDLCEYANVKTEKFSLGMKKKLYLSTMLIGNPKLVILDEPMNGLDVKSVIKFRELLVDFSRNSDVTVLFSSHMLSEMSEICNKIGILKDGILIEEKETYNLFSNDAKVKYVIKTEDTSAVIKLIEDEFPEIVFTNPGEFTSNELELVIDYFLVPQFIQKVCSRNINVLEWYAKSELSEYFMMRNGA